MQTNMITALHSNQAAKTLPDTIQVSELEKNPDAYHGRQLRNLLVAYQIGEAHWRATCKKEEMIQALKEHFPNGTISVMQAPEPEKRGRDRKLMPDTMVSEMITTEKSPRQASGLAGLLHPQSDASFVLTPALRSYLSALSRITRNGTMMNTLLVGPQGCGKTTVAYEFAARLKLPLLKMNCPMVREPRDWFGAKGASQGAVYWDKALFAEAVAQGGLVILLDEITRATPQVLNTLLPLLDWTRETYVEEAKEILQVGPGTYFFATANIGSQFTGTFKLDSALADRFGAMVECTFLSADAERDLLVQRTGIPSDVAAKLVKVAELVRRENMNVGKLSETISTRTLLDVAKLYTELAETAFTFTVLPLFSADGGKTSERAQVMGFIQGQFPGLTL